MLTAHLPSGYVLGKTLKQRWNVPYLVPVALLGAVLPDFDMIWFLFVDQGAIHHHRYWVHVPLFWAAVAFLVLPGIALWARPYLGTAFVFFAALLMHLLLDTLSGGILWGAPVSDHLFTLVTVPASQSHWVLSFLLHWTFVPELLIWAWAIWLWRRQGLETLAG